MKFPHITVAFFAVALAACGGDRTDDGKQGETATATATWIADNGGDNGRARLMYATSATDPYQLKFECPEGGPVYVYPAANPAEGARTYPFTLTVAGYEMPINGGVYNGVVIAAVPPSSFSRILVAPAVSLNVEGQTPIQMDPATEQERAAVTQFFTTCGA